LPSIAGACHTLETGITDEDREAIAIQRAAIARRWAELARRAAPYLDGEHGRLPVYEPDVLALETAIARGATGGELTLLVAGWRDERASDRLQRIAEQAQALAQRLGKAPVVVAIDCDPELRFPAELAPMWSAFVHGLRNAIDHGIEEPAIRAAAGKLAVATLSLRAAVEGEDLVIELADDGRGIDWDRVAEVARARGLPADTAPDLEAALFHAGLSTRAEVTETSGRGIGMAALRAVIDELGAHLTLSSSRGRGTRLRVVWRRRLPTSSRRRYPSSNPIAYPIDPSTTLQTGRP
jgi:two-component system chemotaxis sensor kinase CheA